MRKEVESGLFWKKINIGKNIVMSREEKVAFIICTNSELWFGECKKYIERLHVPTGLQIEIIPIFNATGMANGYN